MSPQIEYVSGDATQPIGEGCRVIVHVCNDLGGWGAGFVLAISRRWLEPEARYRAWHGGKESIPFALGEVQFVQVQQEIWVANMIGQEGLGFRNGKPPVRYEAIRKGLDKVASWAKEHGASVHMPRIGCGLAGGNWAEVERVVNEILIQQGVRAVVYDFAPDRRNA